eukprot:g33993.t1
MLISAVTYSGLFAFAVYAYFQCHELRYPPPFVVAATGQIKREHRPWGVVIGHFLLFQCLGREHQYKFYRTNWN